MIMFPITRMFLQMTSYSDYETDSESDADEFRDVEKSAEQENEALIPLRGMCRFHMYMASKPAKFGIKLLRLTDVDNSYLLQSYIYVGKNTEGVTLSDVEVKLTKQTKTVLRLAAPISGSNRDIIADICLSSVEFVRELGRRKYTYTEIFKMNKKEVPKQFLPEKSEEVGSSKYGLTDDMTLLSHIPKHI
ncbi:hypothetical protein PR048_016494 [Dryococelus australis]|uniref:PiggyBac transposable element-derived protein domain-containing protein n=1 Tax=Dryococelus australis TaxID=614101 RepID=A0ABQ9HJV9_9NEOP|nr:hypothetical protein PR048_016494 [Dryococelus australis]